MKEFTYEEQNRLNSNYVRLEKSQLLPYILNTLNIKVYVIHVAGWYYGFNAEKVFLTEAEALEYLGITKEENEYFKKGKCVEYSKGDGFWYAYVKEYSLKDLYNLAINKNNKDIHKKAVETIMQAIKNAHFEET